MKKGFISSILTLALCLLVGTATAQTYPVKNTTTVSVTATGSGTWTAPDGTWKITKVECWGAGGGGGNAGSKIGAGGGGGGAYAAYSSEIATIPATSFNVKVGAGGTGSNAGGNSYFSASDEANAYAAAGGGKSPGTGSETGAAGGTVSKGTGYAGGAGGRGNHASGGLDAHAGSGGGGGAAGPNGVGGKGGDGTTSVGGAGGTGKAKIGDGGAGGTGVGYRTNGNGGKTYGGGGSGACGAFMTDRTGGTGAQGAIRITYETLTLQVTRDLRYDGAPSENFTILYYDKYKVENLPTPTRDGYFFLGWTTDQAGQKYLTTDSICKKTDNYTIYAQWLYMGTISGTTSITSCANFGVENQTPANTTNGVGFTYKWYLYTNGVSTPIASYGGAPESPTLASGVFAQYTANPGNYSVKRVVKIGNAEPESAGEYTVEVTYDAGNIENVSTTIVPGAPVSITGSELSAGNDYFWIHNGELVPGAIDHNLYIDANVLCSGTHTYQRYAKVSGCPMDSIASENVYAITVANVNPGKIANTPIYTCLNGSYSVENVTEASITPEALITYKWTYAKDGGAETDIPNSDKINIDNNDFDIQPIGAGTYVFKRYAKVACSEWVTGEDSAIIHVVALPASYEAPTPNYTEFCVGGQVVVNPSENWKLNDESLGAYVSPTEYNWMVSMNGNPAQLVSLNDTLKQDLLYAETAYIIHTELIYFNQSACKVATGTVTVMTYPDPTLGKPMLSSKETCPNGAVTLTAGAITGGIGSGPGATYTYTWEFMGGTQTEWDTISANEATYDTYHNNIINASNFFVTGDLKYRTFVSNDRGCDAYSLDTVLNVIEVSVPIVRGDTTVCPEEGNFIAFKAFKTDPSYSLYWYANETTMDYVTATPTVSMTNELDTTMYVAQYNLANSCVSARVPDAIYITYSAHLQYVDASGNLEQEVCQNEPIDDIQFNHGGDCEPQITFDPYLPEGVTIDNSVHGQTAITGMPTEAGTFAYHVALLPDGQTKCAAPNSYDGKIIVNPVYEVTDVQSICAGASYTVSDSWGTTHTYTTSGVYVIEDLKTVSRCDSIVTLDLYVQEWNQFGYDEDETLIAGWTSFSNVNSPISADVAGSKPNSTISYSGWNGSNKSADNLASTSTLVPASGNSLGLINATSRTDVNNGKNIVIQTSTKDYGHIKLKLDYGIERYKWKWPVVYSDDDKGFTELSFAYSTDGVNYSEPVMKTITLEQQERTDGSYEWDLSAASSQNVDNSEHLYIKITFNGAKRSSGVMPEQYSLLDNICISGTKTIDDLTITGDPIVCTNQGISLMATPPYVNTEVEPSVTTPINYKWERIANGASMLLEGHDYYITDEGNIPEGDFQYVVSVGEGECILSDTLDVVGISPAYRLDIVRNGYVCSNEVDQVANIIFTDECEYVPGMFIVTPSVEELREVGLHECQLSIPSETNPCDSVITLKLEVLKAFDTTVVAYLCLGESYTDFGFNFTPTEEGVEYLISPADWKCSTGCDSIYRVTVITNSVQQILSSESDVILAAWDMNTGVNNFKPTCGARTVGAKFAVHETSEFDNVTGHTPSADYCYSDGGSNGALRWANLSSDCSGFPIVPATYTYFNGVYFEIKLNPENYNNLKLKFDYKRDNNNGGAAFNNVNYAYKFAADGEYMNLGSKSIEGTDWSEVDFDLSSIASLNEDELYLKLEFTGGSAGNTQSCGLVTGSKYVPSYITIDNIMIKADRPALTTLDGSAQTCSDNEICEGEGVTFACQGDDDYLKFYLLNENTSVETAFDGNTELTIYPDTTTTYTIRAVDQITYCDSTWTFDVEVIKQPTITYVRGSLDHGICGDVQIDNEILIENAASYSFTWLTEGNVKPAGVIFNDNGEGTITMGGTLTDVPSARYMVEALSDARCLAAPLQKTGVITVRRQPKWNITLGADTVCQGTEMQFQIDTNGLNFVLVPEEDRVLWSTVDGPIASKTDTSIYTLDYDAIEATHSKMHYLTVNQNGCTTLDSVNIVVYNLVSDNLSCTDTTYFMNYGEYFLHADSLITPPVLHNGDAVPQNMIASVLYRRTTSEAWHQPMDSVFVPSLDNPHTTIYWQVTDVCGYVHECDQNITLVLPPCGDDHTVTDIDGNVYGTVRIGFNCWMKENLRTTHYADGTDVPDFRAYQGNDAYPDSAQNAQTFGLLYTWDATVNNTVPANAGEMVQGVCPDGWVVPNAAQFEKMLGIDVKTLRTAEYWLVHDGTNTTDFTLLPAGRYNDVSNRCENLLGNAFFWTSTPYSETEVRTFEADCHCYKWQEVLNPKTAGLSVRCVEVERAIPEVEQYRNT